MSLILEALKKSEARRQLGEAPGLGTPFTVTRRRRNPLPIIVILLLVAAGFGWYYLRATPPAAPAVGAATPTAGTSVKANPGALPPVANTTAAGNRVTPPMSRVPPGGEPANRAAFGAPPRDTRAFNRAAPVPAQSEAGANQPTPDLAQRLLPAAGAPNANFQRRLPPDATNPQPAVVAAPSPLASPPAAATAPRANAVATAAAPSAPATPLPTVAQPPAQTPAPSAAEPKPEPAPASAAPNVPLYYELPFNVRKDLPTLTVSMHVYSATPAQRFVVIDGERRGEGDVVKEGLTVREIRPDGIVLEFRGQRFFYPRPGR